MATWLAQRTACVQRCNGHTARILAFKPLRNAPRFQYYEKETRKYVLHYRCRLGRFVRRFEEYQR